MESKLGRNDKCHCGSNKKYKICCLMNDQDENTIKNEEKVIDILQNTPNEKLKQVMEPFHLKFPNYKLIDVSLHINEDNYRQYQYKFFGKKTIMFIEKNVANSSVFVKRTDTDLNDMMILYNGSYRTFRYDLFARCCNSIFSMIV